MGPTLQQRNFFQEMLMTLSQRLSAITGGEGGSGDVALIFLLLAVACLFLVIIALRPSKSDVTDQPDRLSGALGKLEKIERTVNEFRSESLRSIELFKRETQAIRRELAEIRRLVGGGGGTLDDDPFGGEISGGGGDSGQSATPLEEFSPFESDEVQAPAADELERGLEKTRRGIFSRLKGFFTRKPTLDQASLDELEAELIASDVGPKMASTLVERVRGDMAEGKEVDQLRLEELLKEKVVEVLSRQTASTLAAAPTTRDDGPTVVLIVGVNGVGKTTTIAKLAKRWSDEGKKIVLGAGDTFRAAAVEQLSTWGERLGVPVVKGAADAKPSTVAYEALAEAKKAGADILILDTAGRLHTKTSLMQELEGIRNALRKQQPSAPHHVLLVVDGSTGQNALAQAREFHSATGLTGLVVTKLDGTAKGGIVVAICDEIGIPVEFVGIGEHAAALERFEPSSFAEALFGHAKDVEPIAGEAGASSATILH